MLQLDELLYRRSKSKQNRKLTDEEKRRKRIAEQEAARDRCRARGAHSRQVWSRKWINRRSTYGIYDRTLQEVRVEDPGAFRQMVRLPPEMFDELLDRVGPMITKQDTNYRKALPPGMKLAVTLRHLASGDSYVSQMFGWRIPHNTQSVFVREVCQAICDEYMRDVMVCPTTPEQWQEVADLFEQRYVNRTTKQTHTFRVS